MKLMTFSRMSKLQADLAGSRLAREGGHLP
jgi:hypothetical protein